MGFLPQLVFFIIRTWEAAVHHPLSEETQTITITTPETTAEIIILAGITEIIPIRAEIIIKAVILAAIVAEMPLTRLPTHGSVVVTATKGGIIIKEEVREVIILAT